MPIRWLQRVAVVRRARSYFNMNINELIDLAQSVETEDPIDWGLLSISEHDTYMMIATSVLEQYQTWKEMGDSEKIMLSVILKLIVENFVLNYRLLNGASNG
jgi:hypothetical protein